MMYEVKDMVTTAEELSMLQGELCRPKAGGGGWRGREFLPLFFSFGATPQRKKAGDYSKNKQVGNQGNWCRREAKQNKSDGDENDKYQVKRKKQKVIIKDYYGASLVLYPEQPGRVIGRCALLTFPTLVVSDQPQG